MPPPQNPHFIMPIISVIDKALECWQYARDLDFRQEYKAGVQALKEDLDKVQLDGSEKKYEKIKLCITLKFNLKT